MKLPCLPSTDVNFVNLISNGVFPAYVSHEVILAGVRSAAHGALKLALPGQVSHHVATQSVVVTEGLATEAAGLTTASKLAWRP